MSAGDTDEFISLMEADDQASIELEQMTQEEFLNEI